MNISELLKSQAEKYGDEPFLFFDVAQAILIRDRRYTEIAGELVLVSLE